MVQKVKIKVTNSVPNSWVEINSWKCEIANVIANLSDEIPEQNEIKANLKTRDEIETKLTLTEEIHWDNGSGNIVMTREDYDNYNWTNSENNFILNDFDNFEFINSTDEYSRTWSFTNLHESVVSNIVILTENNIISEQGEILEKKYKINNTVNHEIVEEFEE